MNFNGLIFTFASMSFLSDKVHGATNRLLAFFNKWHIGIVFANEIHSKCSLAVQQSLYTFAPNTVGYLTEE